MCSRERGSQVEEERAGRKQRASKPICRASVPAKSPSTTLAELGRSGIARVVDTSPPGCFRPTRTRETLGTSIQNIFASRRTCSSVWSCIDSIAEMTSPPGQLSLCCTTMLRKFGKTVRGKLDHIESRADKPGPQSSSRHGGNELPTPGDFPTQGDFFKFRKQRGVNLGASPTFPIRCDSYLTASRLVVCVREVDCRSSVSGSSPTGAK